MYDEYYEDDYGEPDDFTDIDIEAERREYEKARGYDEEKVENEMFPSDGSLWEDRWY